MKDIHFLSRGEEMKTNSKFLSIIAILVIVLWAGLAACSGREAQSIEDISTGMRIKLEEDDSDEPGVIITSVTEDGPAADAGVVRGDILLEIDDKPVNSVSEIKAILDELDAGDSVNVIIQHGDDLKELTINTGEGEGDALLGIEVCCGQPQVSFMRKGGFAGQFGAKIVEVLADGPAEDAGIEAEDIIVSVGEQEIASGDELKDIIRDLEPGATVTLGIRKDGENEIIEVDIELGENPDVEGRAYLGVRYHMVQFLFPEGIFLELPPHLDMVPELDLPHFEYDFGHIPEELLLPEGESVMGAVILEVEEDSPAAQAGLKERDVITQVDGERIGSVDEFVDVIHDKEPSEEIELSIVRKGEEKLVEVNIILAEHPEEEGLAYLGVNVGMYIHLQLDGKKEVIMDEYFEKFPPQFDRRKFHFEVLPWIDFGMDEL
jgi:S1-C subfamily serine protease